MASALAKPVSAKLHIPTQGRTTSRVSNRAGLNHSKPVSFARVTLTTRCSDEAANSEASSRRDVLLASGGAIALSAFQSLPALADGELVTFYGAANPPATPGKLGGTTKSKARYTFDVPAGWTEEVISKVEKGTNGTDVRFNGPSRKKEKCFLLTLLNYGGKKGFTMEQPPVPLLKSLTGSLFFFQDALEAGELTAKEITKNGEKFFEYTLTGPESYLIQVTVTDGRVFGFFVTASEKYFETDASVLRTMMDSFDTYPNTVGDV